MHVEDHEYNRRIDRGLLSKWQSWARWALDRQAAPDELTRRRPDRILMDVQLPKLSVLEVTCKIRAGPALAWVPVIAVTSLELCDDDRRALKLGCGAYISKPFRQRDLLGAIRRYTGPHA